MELLDVGVKCPDCGIKFISRQIIDVVDTGVRNSELRQHLGDVRPQYEPWSVSTCPSCGRADWSTCFVPTEEECVLVQARTTPHLQYRAAAIRAERQDRNSFTAALFYLYAAWCADDLDAIPQAKEYRRLALEAFRRSLTDVSCPLDNRAEAEYLIGELLRRTEQFESCRNHFSQVTSRLPGPFAMMARKLMKLAEMRNSSLVEFEGFV